MDIKIVDGKFTQGELSFEIDTQDLAKALQQVDKLTVAQHREIAKLNGIVTEPFDRRLLRPVILGLVQSAWYRAIKKSVPEKVAAAQTKRVADYLKQLEDLKNVSADDLVATRRSKTPKGDGAPKVSSFYALAEDKVTAILAKDVNQRPSETRLSGQQYMVVESIRAVVKSTKQKGATVDQISTAMQPNPYVITPSKTNISFHLNAFKKAGLVIALDKDGKVVPEKEKQKPATKAAAPAGKK